MNHLTRVSMVAFATMVAGIIGMFYAKALFHPTPIAVVPQMAAAALMVWARITFGSRSFHAAASPTAGGIVRTGPYRFIRHPIYTAGILFVVPAAILSGTLAAYAFASLVIAGAVLRMLCEEAMLVRQYPEYADYMRTTSRSIPGIF